MTVQQVAGALTLIGLIGGGVILAEDRYVNTTEMAAATLQYAQVLEHLQRNNKEAQLLNKYERTSIRCEQAAHRLKHKDTRDNRNRLNRCERRRDRLEGQLDKLGKD